MNRLTQTTAVVLAALLVLPAAAAATKTADRPTVKVAIGQWPPFISPDFKHYGVATRIVTEAFAIMGVEAEYRFYPWKRAYFETRQGDQDATAVWQKTPAKEGEVYFSDPVFSMTKVLFYRKDMPFDWDEMEDLAGLQVGATTGYVYSDAFEHAAEAGLITVQRADSDKLNFKKLLRGRIDVFVVGRAVGYYLLNTEFTPAERAQLTHHPKPIQEAICHVLFSKNVPRNRLMVDLFNRGLAKLRANGQMEQYWADSRRGEYLPE